MMPLNMLNVGEEGRIVQISRWSRSRPEGSGSRCQSRYGRAEDLGLRTGKRVEMLQKGKGGPILIKIDESRIAVGRGLACKIMVERPTDLQSVSAPA